MSLNHRQRHQLYRMEARLFRSDPQLAAMLAVFGRLSAGQRMPAWEQVATRLDRVRQATVMIVGAITAVAAAVGFQAGAVRTWLCAIVGRRAWRPLSARERTGPGTDGRPNPAGWS